MKTQLSLNEQICFPVYGSTRIISRLYQPVLAKLQLNYPQYIIMLMLWEEEAVSLKDIRRRLYLNKESLLPILFELKNKNLLEIEEEEVVNAETEIKITETGKKLQIRAKRIPLSMSKLLNTPVEELGSMQLFIRNFLNRFEKNK